MAPRRTPLARGGGLGIDFSERGGEDTTSQKAMWQQGGQPNSVPYGRTTMQVGFGRLVIG